MKIIIFITVCITVAGIFYFIFKKNPYRIKNLPAAEMTLRDTPPIREVALENALRSGNTEEVKKQLDKEAIPLWWNWKSARGKNQGIPAEQVKPEIAKLLIEAGANPDDFENGWAYSKSTPKKRSRAIKIVLKGNKANKHKDFETAKRLYLEALSLDPYLYIAQTALKDIKN